MGCRFNATLVRTVSEHKFSKRVALKVDKRNQPVGNIT